MPDNCTLIIDPIQGNIRIEKTEVLKKSISGEPPEGFDRPAPTYTPSSGGIPENAFDPNNEPDLNEPEPIPSDPTAGEPELPVIEPDIPELEIPEPEVPEPEVPEIEPTNEPDPGEKDPNDYEFGDNPED